MRCTSDARWLANAITIHTSKFKKLWIYNQIYICLLDWTERNYAMKISIQ
jgi:hypothetical protein